MRNVRHQNWRYLILVMTLQKSTPCLPVARSFTLQLSVWPSVGYNDINMHHNHKDNDMLNQVKWNAQQTVVAVVYVVELAK